MNTSPDIDHQDARLMQATDWLLRLNAPEVDEQVAAQWLEWCQNDPENLAAFERMRALWRRFDDKRLSEPLAQNARAMSTESVPYRQPSWRMNLRHLAVAAALLLTVGVSTWFVFRGGGEAAYTQVLRTDVASLHSESLPDGSRVELSARSTVRVRFTQDQRSVIIEDGEAFFDVAKDFDRPFVVQAGALQVTAVGTAFNVRKSGERVVVSVQEGVVRVVSSDPVPTTTVSGSGPVESRPESAEGQVRAGAGVQVIYSAEENTLTMAKVQPGAAAAWRSGRLEFVNEPLAAVVADLNRYSPRPITLEGDRAAAFMYTGTVRSDAIEDWLSAVEEVFPVQVVDRGASGIVIEDRSQR